VAQHKPKPNTAKTKIIILSSSGVSRNSSTI
jgi:hypothetical protein